MDIGEESLKRLSSVGKYNKWLIETVQPYLGSRILEVGCGIGNMTKYLLDKELLVAVDISATYLKILDSNFSAYPNFRSLKAEISHLDSNIIDQLKRYQIDTIVSFNLLEHIKDDIQALKNMYQILENNGRIVLLVPALKWLYGTLDKNAEHYRRYIRKELETKLKLCGFFIDEWFYLNFFGIFGWFLNGKILRSSLLPKSQLRLFNHFVPLFRKVERIIGPPIGQSLVFICHK